MIGPEVFSPDFVLTATQVAKPQLPDAASTLAESLADIPEPASDNDFAWLAALAEGLPTARAELFPGLAIGLQGARLPPAPVVIGAPPQPGLRLARGGPDLPDAGMTLPLAPDVAARPENEPAIHETLRFETERVESAPVAPAAVGKELSRRPAVQAVSIDSIAADSIEIAAPADTGTGRTLVNRAPEAVVQAPLPASPAEQPSFDRALGERLVRMVQHGSRDARLQVHPARLGSIDIHLNVDGDEARLALSSPHAAVREALETALPRLREIMTDVGIDLASVDVGTGESNSSAHADAGRRDGDTGSLRDHATTAETDRIETRVITAPTGLVDVFA